MLHTKRLVLRAFRTEDAESVQALCNNWKIASMVGKIPHPYPDGHAEQWIASHDRDRESGRGYAFCLELDGRPVGAMGLEREGDGVFELGYWLGEDWWGQGLATEAAQRMVRFGFDVLDAQMLTAGHYVCNPASGRVLRKCGFRYTGREKRWCEARGHTVDCHVLDLPRTADRMVVR